MKGQLLALLSVLSLSQAGPVSTRGAKDRWNTNANALLGSSFGIPGNQTFDYVIVGGGTAGMSEAVPCFRALPDSAGLALANRLSENASWTIAVIEAGGFYEINNGNVSEIPLFASVGSDKKPSSLNPLTDWGFVTEPQEVSYLVYSP
jgi:choline dehydrogenase